MFSFRQRKFRSLSVNIKSNDLLFRIHLEIQLNHSTGRLISVATGMKQFFDFFKTGRNILLNYNKMSLFPFQQMNWYIYAAVELHKIYSINYIIIISFGRSNWPVHFYRLAFN